MPSQKPDPEPPGVEPTVTVHCDNCGSKFDPNRQTPHPQYNSNRCSSCGHVHSPISIRNKIEVAVTFDCRADSRRDAKVKGRRVYLMKAAEKVKIGVSKNVQMRQKQLQTGCPDEIELLKTWNPSDALEIESKLHSQLFSRAERGEWFDISDTTATGLIDAIDLFIEAYEKGNRQ
jgi:hypothetical protein